MLGHGIKEALVLSFLYDILVIFMAWAEVVNLGPVRLIQCAAQVG